MSHHKSLRRAGVMAVLMMVSGFSAPAKAQDFFRGFTNLIGVTSEQKDDIEYRERAPLVVPPTTGQLPKPEAPVAQRVSRWPVDPDYSEKKKEASRAPRVGNLSDSNIGEVSQGAPIPGAQMRASGRLANSTAPQEPVANEQVRDYWIDPRVLSAMRMKDEPKLAQGVEPPRRGLTDPPAGARMPAAGAPIRATAEPKGPNLLDDGVNGVRDYQRQSAQP